MHFMSIIVKHLLVIQLCLLVLYVEVIPIMCFMFHQLDCNSLRRFWVSWDDDTIRVGSGYKHDGHVYVEYNDPQFIPVNYLSVSSGFGSQAEWEIQHTQSQFIYFICQIIY